MNTLSGVFNFYQNSRVKQLLLWLTSFLLVHSLCKATILIAAGVSFVFYPTDIRVVSVFFSVRKPMHVFPEKSIYTLNTNGVAHELVCMYVCR